MARPLRLEVEGGVYHITSRGNARQLIFLDGGDKQKFLETLNSVVERFNWLCYAYCLMNNHYQVFIEKYRKLLKGNFETRRFSFDNLAEPEQISNLSLFGSGSARLGWCISRF